MFVVNGVTWRIARVSSGSACLKRSDGSETVGVTDGNICTIYISNKLRGAFLRRVMAHEFCHAFCMSYNIHMPIEQEEYLADWIGLYGAELVYLLDEILSNNMLHKAG